MPFCSASVLSKIYVFDPRPRLPLRIVAKRYWIEEPCPDANDHTLPNAQEDVLTLVFIHGNRAHKEHWEPTIQRLFENQQTATRRPVRFHDMWSLDMPNHGDSAILNEETLQWGYDIFSWEVHARCVHAFLAGLGGGVDVNFSKPSSLHLIEPLLVGHKVRDLDGQLPKIADRQKDIWSCSEEAFLDLRARPFLRAWDERILRILVEHGLRPLPTAEYPDLTKGITLKCTKRQEVATLGDCVSYGIAYRYLPHLLKEIPTHITYGTVMDFIPEEWQQYVLYIASGGFSNFASVTRVAGVGHMILQTHPGAVADIVWKSLTESHKCIPNTKL